MTANELASALKLLGVNIINVTEEVPEFTRYKYKIKYPQIQAGYITQDDVVFVLKTKKSGARRYGHEDFYKLMVKLKSDENDKTTTSI